MALARVPHEIWLQVADHIPEKHLSTLFSVNRSFLDISLDWRYREVRLMLSHDHLTLFKEIQKLRRSRDPFIAARVRSLRIDFDALHGPRTLSASPCSGHTLSPAQTEHLQEMKDAIQDFGKVSTLKLSLLSNCVSPHLLPILSYVAYVLSGKIKSLTIMASPESFGLIIKSLHHLDTLEELYLNLKLGRGPIVRHLDPMVEEIFTAFNRRAALSLHTMSLKSNMLYLDLTHIIKPLLVLHAIKCLKIILPIEEPQSAQRSALAALLRKSSGTVRHVRLGCNSLEFGRRHRAIGNAWIAEILELSKSCLGNLESLTISLPSSKSDLLRRCVHRSANTLNTLQLFGVKLRRQDLQVIFNSPLLNLRVLGLEIKAIAPRLFDFLSSTFPTLDSLSISFHGFEAYVRHERRHELIDFESGMTRRTYPEWRLRHIHLSVLFCDDRHDLEDKAMHILARSAPSIKTFGKLSF